MVLVCVVDLPNFKQGVDLENPLFQMVFKTRQKNMELSLIHI